MGTQFAFFVIFHFADGKRYVLIAQFDFKEIENALLPVGELHGTFSRIGQKYTFVRRTTVLQYLIDTVFIAFCFFGIDRNGYALQNGGYCAINGNFRRNATAYACRRNGDLCAAPFIGNAVNGVIVGRNRCAVCRNR